VRVHAASNASNCSRRATTESASGGTHTGRPGHESGRLITHADIAEDYLGRPGGAGMDRGFLWVASDLPEYETHSTTLADKASGALASVRTVRGAGDVRVARSAKNRAH
jgi:hypothetical protein